MTKTVCNDCGSELPTGYDLYLPGPKKHVDLCFDCLARAFTNLTECETWDEAVEELRGLYRKWGIQEVPIHDLQSA